MDANLYTTVILAGGKASRMSGTDKGLVIYHGQPLIRHVLSVAATQCEQILVSANRNLQAYRALGLTVYSDKLRDFPGPLAGLISCAPHIKTPYTIVLSCDMPNISAKIIEQLKEQLHCDARKYNAAVFRDDQATQCGVFVCESAVLDSIPAFLENNQRAVHQWLKTLNLNQIFWSGERSVFKNINRYSDL